MARTSQPIEERSTSTAYMTSLLALTIGPDGFAVRGADAEDGGNEDVLEGRDEEEGRVLETDNVELVGIDLGWDVPSKADRSQPRRVKEERGQELPSLRSHEEEGEELDSTGDGDLADKRSEDLLRDERGGRPLGNDPLEGLGSTHCGEEISAEVQKSDESALLVTAIGRIRKRSM